jgi:hypothetical protein
MAVLVKPVPFTDDVWREVRALYPKLPDTARKPMEDRIAMYVHLDRSSTPPAERRDVLMDLHDLAEELRRGLAALDGETLMSLIEVPQHPDNDGLEEQPLSYLLRGDRREISQLFTERQAQVAHLGIWLERAAKNVKRGRPGRDAGGFDFLLDQCDLILQHWGAGRLSRSDGNDRTKKFTMLILDTIQSATGVRPLSTGGSAVRKAVTRRGKKAPKVGVRI